jgi:hypothetical protein
MLPACPDCGVRDWLHVRDREGAYTPWWLCACGRVLSNLRGSYIWLFKLN